MTQLQICSTLDIKRPAWKWNQEREVIFQKTRILMLLLNITMAAKNVYDQVAAVRWEDP